MRFLLACTDFQMHAMYIYFLHSASWVILNMCNIKLFVMTKRKSRVF